MANQNRVVEPVKAEQNDESEALGGTVFSHPSYGQAVFSRVTGTKSLRSHD